MILLVSVAGLFLVLLGPAAAHFRLVPPRIGFSLWTVGNVTQLVVLATVTGQIWERGWKPFIVPLFLCLLPVILVGFILIPRLKYPLINDITSSPDDPVEFLDKGSGRGGNARLPSYRTSQLAKLQARAYPHLKRKVFQLSSDLLAPVIEETIESLKGWKLAGGSRTGLQWQGQIESPVFRFIDDFAIRLRDLESGACVDMRSRSRDGIGDFGANAAHIQSFYSALQERLHLQDTVQEAGEEGRSRPFSPSRSVKT